MSKKEFEYLVERTTSIFVVAKTEEEARKKGNKCFKEKMGNTETAVTFSGEYPAKMDE